MKDNSIQIKAYPDEITELRPEDTKAEQLTKGPAVKSVFKIWVFGMLMSLGGFFLGFYMTQLNNFFEYFARGKFGDSLKPKDYDSTQSLLNGFLTIGALLSTIIGGFLMKSFSTKKLNLICMVSLIILNTIQIWIPLSVLYIVRMLLGVIFCMNTFIGPVMIAQCVPQKFISSLGLFLMVFITVGVMVGLSITSDVSEQYWQLFMCIPLFIEIPRMLIFVIFFYFESPYFEYARLKKQFEKKTDKQESDTLKDLFMKSKEIQKHSDCFYKKEDQTTQMETLFEEINTFYDIQQTSGNIIKLACSKEYKRAFLICFMLNFGNQMTGINVIQFYSKQIYRELGFGNVESLVIIGGFVLFVGSLISPLLIKKTGARNLMSWGLMIQALCYISILVGMLFNIGMLVFLSIQFYQIGFLISLGGVLFIYQVQILPSELIPVVSVIQWILSFTVSVVTLPITKAIGIFSLFLFFFFVYLASWLLYEGYGIEIENKSRLQIKNELNSKKFFE